MAVITPAFLIAGPPCLPALAVLQVAILLAVAVDMLRRQVLLYVLLELLNLIDLLSLQFALLFRHFLFSYAVDVFHLVLASLAAAPAVAEEAVFEALAIAVQAALAVVASGLGVRILRLWGVFVKELLE